MIKRLISFFLTLVFLVAVPLSAAYRYNPYTRKLDYYEAAADIVLGDVGDVTLTGLANGDLLYYNGTAWVNLPVGAGATVLTVAAGIPSWQAAGAPAAHAASHEVGGADLVDHDQLTNYLAAQHLTLPNTLVAVLTDHNAAAHVALGFLALPSTIAAVLTDHNLLAHTALGLFDQSSDVDHNLTTNYLAAQHLTLPSTIAAVLTDHNLLAHTALGLFDASIDVDHNATTNYAANQHVVLPGTILNVLSDHNAAAHTALGFATLPSTIALVLTDHNLAAHTALGLFDASADVDHDATTNWVANQHINWTAAASNFSTSEDFFLAWTEAADHAAITQTAVAGTENQALISIDDDRTGATVDEAIEATIYLDVDGLYALYLANGDFGIADNYYYDYTTEHTLLIGYLAGEDLAAGGTYHVYIGESAGLESTTNDYNVGIGYQALRYATTGGQNVAIGYTALSGLDATATTFLQNVGIGYRAGDWIKAGATGNLLIGSDAGRNVQTASYNTYIGLAAGYYPRGDNNVAIGASALHGAADSTASSNIAIGNSASYDILTGAAENISIGHSAGYWTETGDGNIKIGFHAGMGVDTNSNSWNVIIGYQAGEDITTGSSSVVIGYMAGEGWLVAQSNQFIVANTNTATPLLHGDFTTGGMIAASLTHNSDHKVTGYNRYDTISWNDCFDHGTVASKYQFDWDITSLNTQGNGANTVDTTPSEITLTTDNNAIGDNEGTRTEFAVIQRARQNRTEWSLDLKQTANTQFYMGWNTSGTNAMVAAADEYVIVFFDVSDNANWQIKVGDGATEDVFTSAIAGAVAHIIHEVWVETDGTVHWRVNGTELDITGSVDNLMTASDHYLIVGQAQSVTGAAVIVVEIDYVENEKTKAH